jgi:hypothetical protein
MSTFPSSAPSPLISKSEYYSSLPWFRRLLAMLNWRPVFDYELREIEFERIDLRDLADRERERAAIRAQRQAECNLLQLRHQLEPSEPNAQRIRDVISLLEEYGGLV